MLLRSVRDPWPNPIYGLDQQPIRIMGTRFADWGPPTDPRFHFYKLIWVGTRRRTAMPDCWP